MGDPEQPAFGIGNRSPLGEGLDGLDQRLLQHILAIDRRARHAGAIAMQLRPQRAQEAVEIVSLLRRVSHGFARRPHSLDPSSPEHMIIADDRRLVRPWRLEAALDDAGAKGLKGLEVRQGARVAALG
jgi:hypothetical protein